MRSPTAPSTTTTPDLTAPEAAADPAVPGARPEPEAVVEQVYATHLVWPGKGPFDPPASKETPG